MVSGDSQETAAIFLRIEDATVFFSKVSKFTLKIHIVIA